MTLHASLRKSAAASPDHPWLRFGDAAWSYAQGDALTDKIARGLIAQGVQPGDRVALLFTNSPDLVFCYYACMTEIIYCNQPVNLGQRQPGSIGKPFGDIRIRLEDADGNEVPDGEIGEIVIHSGAVTLGYWNDPENAATVLHDGGMHSGDLARRDEDGFLWFTGRTKDIIVRGGSNIAPGEVEDVLYTHPAVYEAGVVGVPCREFGQRVRAYVALKPGADASGRDLMDWAARSIAAYKVPESIVFMAALPKGPTGKVLRKTLRDQAAVSAMEPA
jgi:long-chain acyl-CoA synthetase